MKKLILLLAVCLLTGCYGSPANPLKKEDAKSYVFVTNKDYVIKVHIFEIEGCEYVISNSCIIHKGNCSNPIHGGRE